MRITVAETNCCIARVERLCTKCVLFKTYFTSSLVVLVQHIPNEEISNYRKESFVELYAKLTKRHGANDKYEMPGPEKPRDAEGEELQGSPPRQKRRVGADCKNRDEEYIAGIVYNEVNV